MGNGVTIVALPYVSKAGFAGETFQSVIDAMCLGHMKNTRIVFLRDHPQVGARNAACRVALEAGAEWLMFVDSDMDFPPDTLPRLKALDADIACTDMWSRNWPSFRTVMLFDPPDKNGMKATRPVPGKPEGPMDVDMCGMACTLIRTDFLKRMQGVYPGPWFVSGEHGEDASFCFKARDIGGRIRCDFGITAGHWGVCRMAGQDFTRDARNNSFTLDNPEMMQRMGVLGL